MRNRPKAGLDRFVRETAPDAARALFRKARLAAELAKASLNRRSRVLALDVKLRLLDAALRVNPKLCRRFPDPATGRWLYCSREDGSMHGRRMEEGA